MHTHDNLPAASFSRCGLDFRFPHDFTFTHCTIRLPCIPYITTIGPVRTSTYLLQGTCFHVLCGMRSPFGLTSSFAKLSSRIPTMFFLSPQSCSRLPVFHLFGLLLPWRMLLIMGIPTKCGVGFQNKDGQNAINFDTCDIAYSVFPRRPSLLIELHGSSSTTSMPLFFSPALFAFSSGNSCGYKGSLLLNGTKDLGAFSFRLFRCYVDMGKCLTATFYHPFSLKFYKLAHWLFDGCTLNSISRNEIKACIYAISV
ncbi:hypothetical protein IWX49DRAFT_374064 [Phyllosticta citricarpa]